MIFDAAALSSFRSTQKSTMMHECAIEPYSLSDDGAIVYGDPVTTVCGFRILQRGAGGNRDLYDTVQADAEIRLPLSVSIGVRDRVTLTKSFGAAVDPVRRYEVCELPDSYGPSGHLVRLREVYT